MLHTLPLILLALLPASPAAAATAYDLIVSHKGASFFDGFTFAQGYDNTSEYRSFEVELEKCTNMVFLL